MKLSRRAFIRALATAGATSCWPINSVLAYTDFAHSAQKNPLGASNSFYDIPSFGNVSLFHMTDTHAQLLPTYYREPSFNLGPGGSEDQVPHIHGADFLRKFNINSKSREAYAFTALDFPELAAEYGRMGGYAHIATLIKQLRASRPGSLLLDGGDSWQGSATALWTQGQDMIDASLLLGVDVMTGHWEFTYGIDRVKEVIEKDFKGKIDFVAQNVVDYDFEDHVFDPYVIKEVNGVSIAIIGQAFPYTPIAHPKYLVPGLQFGIQEERMQEVINAVRAKGAQLVVLLSHNGMDVDLKLAGRIRGLDVILGGHTHDAIPEPCIIDNPGGKTVVLNSGSAGKFISLLDLDVRQGKLQDFRFRLVPVFSNMLESDVEMQAHIEKVRAPFKRLLDKKLTVTEDLLYRRGTFNGTFDQIIVDALMQNTDSEIAFSSGFRWGINVLAGESITFEDVMSQTAVTYPEVRKSMVSGNTIKTTLEHIADNRFNPDPYRQQGGDMVRTGGLSYTINPNKTMGHRISNLELNGRKLDAKKIYSVASWASVSKTENTTPVWEVVSDYLLDKKSISIAVNQPRVKKT